MIFSCSMETPLGTMQAAAFADNDAHTGRAALCGLWFTDQKYFPQNRDNWLDTNDCPVFHNLAAWIDAYFSQKKNMPELALAPQGTDFQKCVWKILSGIPYGATCTYSDIAKKIAGKNNSKIFVRAVAGAVGHNPVSLVIPCHRVIGSDGTLKGYAGGLARKRALLELEGFYTL